MANRDEWALSLSDVIETMPDGLLALDADCRIRLWNPSLEKLTGYAAADVVGETCTVLECSSCVGGTREGAMLSSECALLQQSTEQGVVRRECTILSRGGERIPILKSSRILRNGTGHAIGLVETLTDLRFRKRMEAEAASLGNGGNSMQKLRCLVGGSHAMNQVYERIQLAAQSETTVLIQGDTGTGKELVADAIHYLSARKLGPFIKVNCSALPENLLESELFGHVKGAFTGAFSDKIGRFEAAEGGTLLLDEIGDISPLIQLKLLRVMQERVFERVGETTQRSADVRVLVATHRNLREGVAAGKIREDFYYRIKVFDIRSPSLLEHKEDIPVLTAAFVARFNQRTGKQIAGVAPEVNYVFMDYCWPGNVRELENAIEHAFVTCQGNMIELQDLPLELRTVRTRMAECKRETSGTPTVPPPEPPPPGGREELVEVLAACGWNKAEAARRLGV
ncbi:MAG: sigma 54-interacting transcriptional regulator, partial [Verrucomicrobiota bacterium]|nr:sigma 54-interacting transcriptional regulator [Verrucomicrobiota bacterium]